MCGLEDVWIDNNVGDGLNIVVVRVFEDEGSSMVMVLDVFICGMMIGFFFLLGSMIWLLRQDGIWSEKWQIFVGLGVVLSLMVGVVMGLLGILQYGLFFDGFEGLYEQEIKGMGWCYGIRFEFEWGQYVNICDYMMKF